MGFEGCVWRHTGCRGDSCEIELRSSKTGHGQRRTGKDECRVVAGKGDHLLRRDCGTAPTRLLRCTRHCPLPRPDARQGSNGLPGHADLYSLEAGGNSEERGGLTRDGAVAGLNTET